MTRQSKLPSQKLKTLTLSSGSTGCGRSNLMMTGLLLSSRLLERAYTINSTPNHLIVWWRITSLSGSPKHNRKRKDLSKNGFDAWVFEQIHFHSVTASPTRFDTDHFCIVKENPHVFQETLPGTPPHQNIEHVIKLKEIMPKTRPIYMLTPAEDKKLWAHLADALEKGLIWAYKSKFCCVVFIVDKKNGKLCIFTKYRALKEVNITNRFPLPLINERFDSLGGFQCFSKIKITAGYNQIRVREEEIPKTAFQINYYWF